MMTASTEVLERIMDILSGKCVIRPMSQEQKAFMAKETAAAQERLSRRQVAYQEELRKFRKRFER